MVRWREGGGSGVKPCIGYDIPLRGAQQPLEWYAKNCDMHEKGNYAVSAGDMAYRGSVRAVKGSDSLLPEYPGRAVHNAQIRTAGNLQVIFRSQEMVSERRLSPLSSMMFVGADLEQKCD